MIASELGPNSAGGGRLARAAEPALPARGALRPDALPAPEVEGDLSLGMLWRILLKWRALILSFVIGGLLVGVLLAVLTTPLYRAAVTMEVNRPPAPIVQGTEVEPSPVQDAQFLATQYELLRSRTLAERVATELRLSENPAFASAAAPRPARVRGAARLLLNNLTVAPVNNSRLIRLSYVDADPALAAKISDSFSSNFIAANLERKFETTSYARKFLEQRIATVKPALERSERDLVQYAQQQRLVSVGGATESTGAGGTGESLDGASLAALNTALATAQTERIAAQERARQAQAGGITLSELNSANVQNLRAERAKLQTEYGEKLNLYKADFPEMVRLKTRIDTLGSQINAETSNLTNAIQADYRAAAAREGQLVARVNALKSSVLDTRGRAIRYTILQREVESNRSLYQALLQRYKEIGVSSGVTTNLISIVDNAQVPNAPFQPNLPYNLLVGLAAGLLLGCLIAVGIEFIDDTIKLPSDVEGKLHLSTLGIIPKLKRGETFRHEISDTGSEVAEAYYSVRTSLQFSTEHGVPRTLLVTSARAGEGKSSTLLALARNFAGLDMRVLLIDADLRKPTFVASQPSMGLSTVLTGGCSVADAVVETPVDNLYLLPSGPVPPRPAELLGSPSFRGLIEEAKQHFDLVIVDSPPVMGLADAPLLSAVCEGVLLVMQSGLIRRPAALAMVNRLRGANANILGVVLTKFSARAAEGSYGYGYGYGYSYRQEEGQSEKAAARLASDRQISLFENQG